MVTLTLMVRAVEADMPMISVFRADGLRIQAVSKGFTGSLSMWPEWDTYAHISVNGVEVFSGRGGGAGARGINVSVIDKATGAVEASGHFDTWLGTSARYSYDNKTWVESSARLMLLSAFCHRSAPGKLLLWRRLMQCSTLEMSHRMGGSSATWNPWGAATLSQSNSFHGLWFMTPIVVSSAKPSGMGK